MPFVGLSLFKKDTTLSKESQIPFQELRDIKITTDSEEGELWRMEASRALIDSGDVALLYDVTFISDRKGVILKAPKGRYDISTGKADLSGGVTITLPDGSGRIESLSIENGHIKSYDPVIIERGFLKISGHGLKTDSSGNLRILRDVKVELK